MISLLLIVLGIWAFFRPEEVLSLKVKWAKYFGATLKTSAKTVKAVKYLGAILAILGLGTMI
ncbi:MAG: hypothetical protein ACMG6E_01370 [Candidatus Roizmanbacteria bacterium]